VKERDRQTSGIEIGKVKQANECISVWDFSLSGFGEGSRGKAGTSGAVFSAVTRRGRGDWVGGGCQKTL